MMRLGIFYFTRDVFGLLSYGRIPGFINQIEIDLQDKGARTRCQEVFVPTVKVTESIKVDENIGHLLRNTFLLMWSAISFYSNTATMVC